MFILAWSLLYLMDFFVNIYDIHDHNTRISNYLPVSPSYSNLSKGSIRYQGVIIWNKILKADINSNGSKLSPKIILKKGNSTGYYHVISRDEQEFIQFVPPWGFYLPFATTYSTICYWYTLMCLLHVNDDVPLCCVYYSVYIMINKGIINPTRIDFTFEGVYLIGQWPYPCQLGLI